MKDTAKREKKKGRYSTGTDPLPKHSKYDLDPSLPILMASQLSAPRIQFGRETADLQQFIIDHHWTSIDHNGITLYDAEAFYVVEKTREGLSGQQAQELAKRLELTDIETAKVLTISTRTYHRQKTEERLNPVATERLLLLTKLADHGLDVFEDQGKFNRWLRRPLRVLGSRSPLELLDTSTGIGMVETILERIDYGVYS